MSYRSTRFCLVLVCALCIGSPAFSQSREDPAKTARLGPGAVGDCIDPAGLFSFPKPYTWRILGNSLYDIVVDGREVCYEKIVDLPVDILAFRNEHEKGTDICRIWTENGVYLYHEETRVLEEERAEGAISSFLSYPIVRTSAHTDPRGWLSERADGEPSATERSRPRLRDEERSVNDGIGAGTTMINGVRVDDLTDALRSVNRDPYRIPSLADFEIGDDAIDRFREEVDAWSLYYRVKEAGDKETEPSFLERDQPILTPSERYLPIYRALPDMIERVASNVVIDALNDQRDRGHEESIGTVYVYLINEADDTLVCSHRGHATDRQPLLLPWRLAYRGEEFETFNPELARALTRLTKNAESRTILQDHVRLLYVVAQKIGERREKGR